MRKSVLYFLICLISVMTLQIYMSGIDRTEKQLSQLSSATRINAVVTSLDGTKYNGLQIRESIIYGLEKSTHIKDLKVTLMLQAGIGEYSDERMGKHVVWGVVGANTFECLNESYQDDITWLPGYGPEFLTGDDIVCMVDKIFLNTCDVKLGDTIPLDLYYYKYGSRGEVYFETLGLTDTLIIATTDRIAIENNPSIIIPFNAGRDLFIANDVQFNAASCSFYVKDPSQLNDFKTEMKSLLLAEVRPSADVSMMIASNTGAALVVNDATFVIAATRLEESLSLLRGFFPVLALVLAAIGYFIAYLMIQNRREEYALFRLLGLNMGLSISLYFFEIFVLTIAGSFLGTFISVALNIGDFTSGVRVFFMLSICFMLGSLIALLRLGRTNIMLALSQQD